MPTQLEYNLTKKQQRVEKVRIDLLDFNMNKVDELSGVVLEKPTFNISATSDLRRSCSIKITPNDNTYLIEKGSKLWLDKYIQIYCGIKISNSDQFEYTNMGIYLINNPSQVYNATQNIINIDGLDLMSKLTGLRNGNLEGIKYVIPQGSSVREAIVTIIKEAGFSKYSVEEMYVDIDNVTQQTTPYEITIDIGGTVYDLLNQLVNIIPTYQMYFDVNGTFCFNRIPNGVNEQIMVDDDIWKPLVISYQKDVDYTEVKNVVEIFGRIHDIENYGEATINQQTNVISVNIASVTSIYDFLKIGFTMTSTTGYQKKLYITVNNLGTYEIVNENGEYVLLYDIMGYYVIRFDSSINKFIYLGNIQPYAILKENNPNSPFYVGAELGGYVSDVGYSENGDCQINFMFDEDYFYNEVFNNGKYLSIQIPDDIVSDRLIIFFYTKNGKWGEGYGYQINKSNVSLGRYLLKGNPNETFDITIDNSIGRIRKVFQGGEYENITSDYLAQQRAIYELYTNCRINDKITINCVPIYWLDVNWVVELTLYDKQQNYSSTDLYIIKEISISDTQSISLMKYYPLYPSV